MNVCSVTRLVTLVQTKAGTYPTLDPSWYGCTAAVLSALEVNIATICASLPVFWPVITENLGKIMVTYEVDVRHETRDSGGFNVLNENGEQLYSMGTLGSKGKQCADDRYIGARVDPLLQQARSTNTTVMSGGQCEYRVEANDIPLDLGADFTEGLAGYGLQRPGIEERESREGLLH